MTKSPILILLLISILTSITCSGMNETFYSDSIRAIELNRKGNDLGRQGLYSQSLKIHQENLSLRQKLYGDISEKLGPAYLGIGNAYKNLGQIEHALKYYKLAEFNYGIKGNRILYISLGGVYRSKLDYFNALKYYRQALDIALMDNLLTKEQIAGNFYNIADSYYYLNQYEEALKICLDQIKYSSPDVKILYFDLIGSIYQVKGDISQAKRNFLNSIQITKELYGKSSNNLAISYIMFANFLIENDQYTEARKILKGIENIVKQPEFSSKKTLSDYYKSEGYWINNFPVATNDINLFKKQKAQNIGVAIEWYLKSLDALNFKTDFKNFDISDAEKSISLKNSIELLKFIADAYFEMDELKNETTANYVSDNLNKSLEIYQIAGKLIQKARIEIVNEESKIELTNLESETFNQVIKIACKAYSLKKELKYFELAFQNAEKLKSSSLFDKISGELPLENTL